MIIFWSRFQTEKLRHKKERPGLASVPKAPARGSSLLGQEARPSRCAPHGLPADAARPPCGAATLGTVWEPAAHTAPAPASLQGANHYSGRGGRPGAQHPRPRAHTGGRPDLLLGTMVRPLHGLRRWLQQVLAAREGEVHLHTGVGAHLAGLWTHVRDSVMPVWHQARGTACRVSAEPLLPAGRPTLKAAGTGQRWNPRASRGRCRGQSGRPSKTKARSDHTAQQFPARAQAPEKPLAQNPYTRPRSVRSSDRRQHGPRALRRGRSSPQTHSLDVLLRDTSRTRSHPCATPTTGKPRG